MRIDFREIEVTDIEGNKSTVDISKALGNAMYQKTAELAQNIYKNGEVELSPEQVKSVKKYTSTCFVAYVQMAVNKILLEACEQKVQ